MCKGCVAFNAVADRGYRDGVRNLECDAALWEEAGDTRRGESYGGENFLGGRGVRRTGRLSC